MLLTSKKHKATYVTYVKYKDPSIVITLPFVTSVMQNHSGLLTQTLILLGRVFAKTTLDIPR